MLHIHYEWSRTSKEVISKGRSHWKCVSSRDTIPLFTRALIAISMAANHPSLLMRAMQIENAISPHEADDPDLEKRLPDLQVGNGLTKKKKSVLSAFILGWTHCQSIIISICSERPLIVLFVFKGLLDNWDWIMTKTKRLFFYLLRLFMYHQADDHCPKELLAA